MIELPTDLLIFTLLFATGIIAGTVDAIAGGGGLIALPMLMATGISPIQALATNKFQGAFGTFSASLFFIQKRMVKPRKIAFTIACTFIGSMLGTRLVQHIDPSLLSGLIPVLLILVALYFLFGPSMQDERRDQRIGMNLFALSVGFGGGFYDGFFGPGTGSLFIAGFVGLAGYGLLAATAHTKMLNFTSNIASLLLFIGGGQVVWSYGIAMALGQFIGARLGAHWAHQKGAALIRPVLIVVTLVISAKLLFDAFST